MSETQSCVVKRLAKFGFLAMDKRKSILDKGYMYFMYYDMCYMTRKLCYLAYFMVYCADVFCLYVDKYYLLFSYMHVVLGNGHCCGTLCLMLNND